MHLSHRSVQIHISFKTHGCNLHDSGGDVACPCRQTSPSKIGITQCDEFDTHQVPFVGVCATWRAWPWRRAGQRCCTQPDEIRAEHADCEQVGVYQAALVNVHRVHCGGHQHHADDERECNEADVACAARAWCKGGIQEAHHQQGSCNRKRSQRCCNCNEVSVATLSVEPLPDLEGCPKDKDGLQRQKEGASHCHDPKEALRAVPWVYIHGKYDRSGPQGYT